MAENCFLWSVTASDNDDADPAVPWVENMLPGAVNNVARSTMAAVARLLKDLNGSVTTAGSSNTYTATSNSGHSAYADGILLTAKANHTNNGPATLNLNAYGAKAIRMFGPGGETELIGNEIRSGGTYQFRYDTALNSAAGAFLLLNPTVAQDVGTIKIWPSDTAPTSWLFCNGSAVSRTTYATLFTALASGAIFGSGDGSTTFNVPDLRGRAPFGTDDMLAATAGRVTNTKSGIVGTTLGAAGGAEDHTLTLAQTPAHDHGGAVSSVSNHTHSGSTDAESASHTHTRKKYTGNSILMQGGGAISVLESITEATEATDNASNAHTHAFNTGSAGGHSHVIASVGSGASHSNMPPAIMLNFIIKA